jgi:orotidine-5'-phosphate decarboxylase
MAESMHNPVIVALDVPAATQALALVKQLSAHVGAFKVGSELFTVAGPDLVREIRRLGAAVFLDLKFHDIPNTVAKAVAAAVQLDVQMLTVHTSGGMEMLRAAERSARETAEKLRQNPPLILGVTVLTSLDSNELNEIGFTANAARQVERLATLAAKAQIGGLVCSPLEVVALRQMLPSQMKLVTPGIRGPSDPAGDQKRTLSPAEAIQAGADWLVIGRPIYTAPEPAAAARAIQASLDAHRPVRMDPPQNRFGL